MPTMIKYVKVYQTKSTYEKNSRKLVNKIIPINLQKIVVWIINYVLMTFISQRDLEIPIDL